MTYNPNIPLGTDIPSQSQAQFLTNFQQLNTVFDIDHIPFNDVTAANRGKHDKSTYVELAVDPATAVNEVALYSKEVTGITELFIRAESAGAVTQVSTVPFTNVANAGTAGGTITFYDTIFGIRIYTGQTANLSSGSQRSVVFPIPYTTILTGLACAHDPNAVAVSCQIATNQLLLRVANAVIVNWFAIGRL